ncbi:MAG: restriction endonuclease subunit S [Pseudomonas sp.]|uniref:restriction endonuclease subunit S n=1 Tax=Pseudomonas sp. TaxID=306 RepID=UPI00271E6985|nr:restriction endonuclease subunit S [Pseudomonas sp.]MDO9618385.1 restriction endonuclease subunit S [Pseudomonas sp.]MDP2445370.1 restriction endonuclease subunit S [Pseudomonas sp.]
MSGTKLADVAHVIMGQSPDGTTYNKNRVGFPLLNGPAEFGATTPVAVQWTTAPTKIAARGDILFCVRGNTLGRQNIADQEYVIGRGLAAIRARSDKADTDYIGLWLRHKADALLAAGNGSTFPSVSGEFLEAQPFPEANEREQRQIAARLQAQLAEVETARQAAQLQLSDTRLLRARMLKAFFAELDGATKKKLGDYAETTSGSTPSRGNKQYWQPAEIAWVKTGEVAFAPITATEEAISKAALAECSLTLLPPKSVLIAMYGQGKTRGQSAILEIPATTNQACFAILPNDTWESDFLYLWLKSSYQDLRDLSEDRGGNQANLNGALLKALEVPAPSKTEQQHIVARIQAAMTEIDALENSSKAALEDINRLPNRVLAQAFEV